VKIVLFVVKFTDAPRAKPSQKLALECLKLDRLDIICPGSASYPLDEKVHVTGLEKAAELFKGLKLDKPRVWEIQ
jgi:hypothetical protein